MSYREIFRGDYIVVSKHLEGRVAVRVGRPVEESTPTIVDAYELRDALDEFLEADDR